MKVVIFGASGMVGQRLKTAKNIGWRLLLW
jgi:dTDP-4-dehydrorhamnose reductase